MDKVLNLIREYGKACLVAGQENGKGRVSPAGLVKIGRAQEIEEELIRAIRKIAPEQGDE